MSNKPPLTAEKIIEHHLLQNVGQKLTPHLIAGLVVMVSQNLRNSGFIVQDVVLSPTVQEPRND